MKRDLLGERLSVVRWNAGKIKVEDTANMVTPLREIPLMEQGVRGINKVY